MERYNSGWSVSESARLSPGVLALRGREIVEKLRNRGLRIPQGNRLEQAITLTEKINDDHTLISPSNERMVYRSREAFRTLLEAFIIVYTIYDRPKNIGWYTNEMLGSLLRGAETEDIEAKSHPRNIQFELFVAATLVLGGTDVRLGEPDFRMTFHSTEVGVAVKRVRSLNPGTLKDELSDASKQIARANRQGFIAVNLDRWITELDTSSDLEALGESFARQVENAHRAMYDLSIRDTLLGYFLFGVWFTWDFAGELPRLEFHAPHQVRCFAEDDQTVIRCREFFEPLQHRTSRSLASAFELISRPEQPGT